MITPFVSSAVAGHDNLVHLRGNELSLNTFINGVSFYDNPHQLFTPGLAPEGAALNQAPLGRIHGLARPLRHLMRRRVAFDACARAVNASPPSAA